MKKPNTCHGCPFYDTGDGFVPDEYVEGSDVLVMGQNPGEDEVLGRQAVEVRGRDVTYEPHTSAPYLGRTGLVMRQRYLPLAGLERGSVSLANPIRCRVKGNNKLPSVKSIVLREAMTHCQSHYFKPPASTRLIVAEGEYALLATTGEDGKDSPGFKISRGVEGWRGWVLPYNPHPKPRLVHSTVYTPTSRDIAVLATYHVAYLFRAPWYEPCASRDWAMIPRILAGEWPKPLPPIGSESPERWPDLSAFDTEFHGPVLVRYSSASQGVHGLSVQVVEREDIGAPRVGTRAPTVIFHNTEADMWHLSKILGGASVTVEDSMHLHAVLWPDLDHDLDFVGSMYSQINRWKHLVHTNPREYSAGDAIGTWDSFHGLARELDRDPRSKHVYYTYQLPLIPIIARARHFGARVDLERAALAVTDLTTQQQEATRLAQAVVGWPINLGSVPQVKRQLYDIEKISE